jgi:UDP-N-acetylmuramate--alanine ligase
MPRHRISALFQPHRYTRTRALLHDFPPAFAGIDRLWLLPVYAASEPPLQGGRSTDLLTALAQTDALAVRYVEAAADAEAEILHTLQPNDLLLVIGAGDIHQSAQRLAAALEK